MCSSQVVVWDFFHQQYLPLRKKQKNAFWRISEKQKNKNLAVFVSFLKKTTDEPEEW